VRKRLEENPRQQPFPLIAVVSFPSNSYFHLIKRNYGMKDAIEINLLCIRLQPKYYSRTGASSSLLMGSKSNELCLYSPQRGLVDDSVELTCHRSNSKRILREVLLLCRLSVLLINLSSAFYFTHHCHSYSSPRLKISKNK
jgi:hypothetical protein